jgi:chromodomain-helicase-DNA-binding protein 4
LRTQKTLKEPCIVCSFLHPAVWECPEMKSEVKLRLALDKLRGVTNQDVQILRDKKAFLVEKILKVQAPLPQDYM